MTERKKAGQGNEQSGEEREDYLFFPEYLHSIKRVSKPSNDRRKRNRNCRRDKMLSPVQEKKMVLEERRKNL